MHTLPTIMTTPSPRRSVRTLITASLFAAVAFVTHRVRRAASDRRPPLGIPSALLAALLVLTAPAADAQVAPYVGYNAQHENPVYGAAYQVPLGRSLIVSPSLEAGLGSGDNYVQAGADLTANLAARRSLILPYVGLGIAAGSMPIAGETKARVGGNALAGVRLGGFGGFVPFAQARYTNVRGGDALALQAGASLRL